MKVEDKRQEIRHKTQNTKHKIQNTKYLPNTKYRAYIKVFGMPGSVKLHNLHNLHILQVFIFNYLPTLAVSTFDFRVILKGGCRIETFG